MANLKAVLQRPKIAESYARNAFDRSCSVNFSYQLGALDCFYAEPFIAGSHVKLNRAIFQRTADVNTAAFPKIDTHVEFFAVPIRLLWTYWNNFKLNIQDFNSSVMGTLSGASRTFNPFSLGSTSCPTMDIHDILKDINEVLYGSNAQYTPKYFFVGQNTYKEQATGALRLLAGMGYGQYPNRYMSDTGTDVYSVNPFKLLAYQKVYYDHFRNTAYESNDPSFYNVDFVTSQGSAMLPRDINKLLTYRFVNYRKDYLQAIYPSLNGTTSLPSGVSWLIPDSVVYRENSTQFVSGSATGNGQTRISGSVNSTQTASFNTVQQIRAAFALDKLLRASAYAPKHVKDQFEARYGIKGVETGNESVRIGAFMNDIVIQEVVNTAANLGEIGGKGVGYNGYGKDIEFTCKEDSIILGICYSLPRTSYDATQVMNWNSKIDREDFFIPEFMDLGFQPISWGENSFLLMSAGVESVQFNSLTGAYGFKDRYSEYKIGIDRNLGNFVKGGALSDFVVHSNQGYNTSYGPATANYFKVKPTDLDSVFAQNTLMSDITTDKFITHMDIRVICNQNMSVHGQPRIGGFS